MLKYVKMILLVGALSAVVSGCVDSDDPDFQVGLERAYVIQKNTQSGGKQFAFYGTVMALYGTATSIELTKDYMPLPLNKLGENFYEINEWRMMWGGALASVNGTYTISALDEKGIAAQNQFKLQIDKEMGNLTITEPLKYENGRITAQWEEVENATAYCILVGRGVKDNNSGVVRFYRINASYCSWEQSPIKTTGVFDPSTGTGNNTYLPNGTELIVAVVAAYQAPSYGGVLYLEGDYYKIVVGTDGVTPVHGFN